MTINLDTEIVSSSFDKKKHTHTYTLERHGKRWTVTIPDTEVAQFGPIMGAQAGVNKNRRRNYLAAKLTDRMCGEPDA